jgi:uncharacterized LabA/DUF88 family protein
MKVLFLVDLSNLYYSVKAAFQSKVDFQKLYDLAKGDNVIYRAICYGSELNDESRHFKTYLSSCGYEYKYKEPSIFPIPNSDRQNRKADWDVGIAMDAVALCHEVDIVVFATADGDMAPCLDFLKSKGKECVVIGCCISHELKKRVKCIEISRNLLEQTYEKPFIDSSTYE